jgi:hypothetical protein
MIILLHFSFLYLERYMCLYHFLAYALMKLKQLHYVCFPPVLDLPVMVLSCLQQLSLSTNQNVGVQEEELFLSIIGG